MQVADVQRILGLGVVKIADSCDVVNGCMEMKLGHRTIRKPLSEKEKISLAFKLVRELQREAAEPTVLD